MEPMPHFGEVYFCLAPLQTTFIMTKVTLLGQWEDELAKFAPQLRVHRYHAGTRAIIESGALDLNDVDVLLGTTTTKFRGSESVKFHRVIIDEAQGGVRFYASSYRWACTGTPMSQSMSDLTSVAAWIGHDEHGLKLRVLVHALGHALPRRRSVAAGELVVALKKLMIRHTKAQQIGGGQALMLPSLDAETVWCTMTPPERDCYDLALEAEACSTRHATLREKGGTAFGLSMALLQRRAACSNAYAFLERSQPGPRRLHSVV